MASLKLNQRRLCSVISSISEKSGEIKDSDEFRFLPKPALSVVEEVGMTILDFFALNRLLSPFFTSLNSYLFQKNSARVVDRGCYHPQGDRLCGTQINIAQQNCSQTRATDYRTRIQRMDESARISFEVILPPVPLDEGIYPLGRSFLLPGFSRG